MMISIEIKSNENDAFSGDPREEVLRIIREAVKLAESGRQGYVHLNDYNGNKAGLMYIDTPEEDPEDE